LKLVWEFREGDEEEEEEGRCRRGETAGTQQEGNVRSVVVVFQDDLKKKNLTRF